MKNTLENYKGYEIPASTSKLARKVLRKLKRNGVVTFTHDDGPASSVRRELVEIAGSVGIKLFEEDHEIVLILKAKRIDGSEASEKACTRDESN